MSARLEVQLQDLDASSALRKLAEACEDLRKPLESIGGHLRTSTNLRFLNQVDPDGQPWKPSKRARKLGGKTLIDRGAPIRRGQGGDRRRPRAQGEPSLWPSAAGARDQQCAQPSAQDVHAGTPHDRLDRHRR